MAAEYIATLCHEYRRLLARQSLEYLSLDESSRLADLENVLNRIAQVLHSWEGKQFKNLFAKAHPSCTTTSQTQHARHSA